MKANKKTSKVFSIFAKIMFFCKKLFHFSFRCVELWVKKMPAKPKTSSKPHQTIVKNCHGTSKRTTSRPWIHRAPANKGHCAVKNCAKQGAAGAHVRRASSTSSNRQFIVPMCHKHNNTHNHQPMKLNQGVCLASKNRALKHKWKIFILVWILSVVFFWWLNETLNYVLQDLFDVDFLSWNWLFCEGVGCAQELCAPCGLQQNNKVDFGASNLACLSESHFCRTDTRRFLFLEISYLWNAFPFLFSQFPFRFPFSKLFSQFLFPNKHASKPKRIKHKPRAADSVATIQTHTLPPAAPTNHNRRSHKTAAPRNPPPPHHQTLCLSLSIFITSLQCLSSHQPSGSHKGPGYKRRHWLVVVPGLSTQIIFGRPIMKKIGMVLDFDQNTIEIRKLTQGILWFPMEMGTDKRVQAMIPLNNEGELWAAERLTLKPRQVHRIRVNLKKSVINLPCILDLLCPWNELAHI